MRRVLAGIGFLMNQRVSAGPNVPVEWDQGPEAPSMDGDRPPNAILVLADDLGWNDLTFGGGGVAGGTVPTPNIDCGRR